MPRQQRLNHLQPNRIIQPRAAIARHAAGLQRAQRPPVGAAGTLRAPQRPGRPRAPPYVLVVGGHVFDGLREVGVAHGVVVAAELGHHGFQLVGAQPFGQAVEVGGEGLVADGVPAAEVVVEVFVDVHGRVVDGVDEFVQVVGRWGVVLAAAVPDVPACVTVAGRDDELLRSGGADAVDLLWELSVSASEGYEAKGDRLTAAWSFVKTNEVGMSCGSFIMPKITFSLCT